MPAIKVNASGIAVFAAGFVATLLTRQASLVRRARHMTLAAPPHRAFETHGIGPLRTRVLLAGDSTGVFATSMPRGLSLPAFLAEQFGPIELVNVCRNGAQMADVIEQLDAVARPKARFDIALVFAGGNDVLQSTRPAALARQTRSVIDKARVLADRTVWVGCPNLGLAPVFLPPLSWWFSWRTRCTAQLLADVARAHGVDFVDFAGDEHHRQIRSCRASYFAADGVHPSVEAYGYCFEVLGRRPAIDELRQMRRPAAGGQALSAA